MKRAAVAQIDDIGFVFLRNTLLGERGAAGKLWPAIQNKGRVLAVSAEPRKVTTESDLSLGAGRSSGPAVRWVIENASGLFADGSDGSLIFQDIWAQPSDFRHAERSSVFLVDDCAYRRCGPQDIHKSFMCCLRNVLSYRKVIVFIAYRLPPLHEIDCASFYNLILAHLRAVYVTAFDQEGFVVWQASQGVSDRSPITP